MGDGAAVPVGAGLAAGIALVVLLASLFNTVDMDLEKGRDYLDLSVEGVKETYQVGEKMDFIVKAKGYAECGYPTARIVNTDLDDTVYNIFRMPFVICFSDEARPIDETWTLEDIGVVVDIIPEKSGNYKAIVQYGDKVIEKWFTAVDDLHR